MVTKIKRHAQNILNNIISHNIYKIFKIIKTCWSFTKVPFPPLSLRDKQTDIQMKNHTHSMAPSSLYKHTKQELCTIILSRASPI